MPSYYFREHELLSGARGGYESLRRSACSAYVKASRYSKVAPVSVMVIIITLVVADPSVRGGYQVR
jgi:hypothetical protein